MSLEFKCVIRFYSRRHIANLCTIAYGILVGWMAAQLTLYKSENCPLPSGVVTKDEVGWIASVIGIGGLVGTVAGGWMVDRFGRKNSLLSMAIPQTVC